MSEFTIRLENQANTETTLAYIESLFSLKETAVRLFNLRNATFVYEDSEGNNLPIETGKDFENFMETSKGKSAIKLIAKRNTNNRNISKLRDDLEDLNKEENIEDSDTRKSRRINLKLRKGEGKINSGYSKYELERIQNIRIKKELQKESNDEKYKIKIGKIMINSKGNKPDKLKRNCNKKNREDLSLL